MTLPVTATTSANSYESTQATGNPNGTLGKNDFLKLFTIQLTHQDPSNPMDDSQMMAQMAQFSTLEQVSNLADNSLRANVIGLIGKTVTYRNQQGELVTGEVTKVSTATGAATLTVGTVDNVDPSLITDVAK